MKKIRILSLLTAGSAFYLLIAGAQVNAYQAAGSVPTWPLSYGHILLPEWPGNLFYEQHHRATAGTTMLLFAALWIALVRRGQPAAARRMAHWAGSALALQVVMGGLVVLHLNPPWLGALHAIAAIATVALIAATALIVWDLELARAETPEARKIQRRSAIAIWWLALQVTFGAVSRHPPVGELTYITTLMAHLLSGVLLTMFLVLLASSMIRRPMEDGFKVRGWSLLAAVIGQVVVGAWIFVVSPAPFEEAWPPPAGFAAGHAAHIVLAAAIATCLIAALPLGGSAARKDQAASN